MKCPFGKEVGDPPTLERCPSGFPGCGCGDELVIGTLGYPDERTTIVLDFWQRHGHEL